MTDEPHVLGVVPVRYDSSRWPGKALAEVRGRPLIWWAWDALRRAASVSDVILATDDARIAEAAERFGATVCTTSGGCRNGTERVAEVSRAHCADVYVNVQADQVALDPAAVDELVANMVRNPAWEYGTLARSVGVDDDRLDRDAVYVTLRADGTAGEFRRGGTGVALDGSALRHIGAYAYKPDSLRAYAEAPQSPGELAHSLEQLRMQAMGRSIGVVAVQTDVESFDREPVLAIGE